ncbi:MAG: HesA/MoeB/ThiF family protein [Methanobacteriota archaeon]|nr:MAG: HesA/MoeB/ThiF family protein [Euryarchaeota archaeon]
MNEDRYSRQTLLKEIGSEGQKKISKGKAVVVGCGALGTHASSLLVRAGVGETVIVDSDTVDITNLHRQTLFGERAIGKNKAEVAERLLREINSEVEVKGIITRVTTENAEEIIAGSSVVVDATDNMDARFIVNDACVKLRIPWIYGGAVATSGMVFSILPDGPCLRCIFPKLPPKRSLPTCDDVGIVNSLPSIVASLEVTEAFKVLIGEDPTPELMVVDAWSGDVQKIRVTRNPDCVSCGKHDFYNYDG